MDFQSLKRKELQALCKKNNIPANITNAAMANALASLDTVEGVEECLRLSETYGPESPERSVVDSPGDPRTSNRQKISMEDIESSKFATRTRCGTRRRATEGTSTRKTPATRTTRRRAPQEASIQGNMDKDLQAEFEADLKKSEVSDNNGLPGGVSMEISEEVSGVSVDQEAQVLSESPSEPQDVVLEIDDDGQEIIDMNDYKENMKEEHIENEAQEDPIQVFNGSQKVDFHCLSRRDLQNLCKKNKIAANMTNAAMADALESLESVEGLEEFLKDCDSHATKSPETSRMTSSCLRGSKTSQKPAKEPQTSNLLIKSCRGTRRRVVEEIKQVERDVCETPAAPSTRRKAAQAASALCKMETLQKKEGSVVQVFSRRGSTRSAMKKMEDSSVKDSRECPVVIDTSEGELPVESHPDAVLERSDISDCVSENSFNGELNSMSQEVSKEPDTWVVESENGVGLKGDDAEESSQISGCDFSGELVASLNIINDSNIEDELEPVAEHCPAVVFEEEESSLSETGDKLQEDALETEDKLQEDAGKTEEKLQEDALDKESDITRTFESEITSCDGPNVDEGLMQEATEAGNEEFVKSDDNHFSNLSEDEFRSEDNSREVNDGLLNTEILKQLEDSVDEIDVDVVEDTSAQVSDVADVVNSASKDDGLKFGSPSPLSLSSEVQDLSSLEINLDGVIGVYENCQQDVEQPVTVLSNVTTHLCPIEKLDGGSRAEDEISDKSDSESHAQVQVHQHAAKGKKTPLGHKSLRKLKRMLREKLQATTLLERKMENLTLEESEVPQVEKDLQKGFEEGVSNDIDSMGESGFGDEELEDEGDGKTDTEDDLEMKVTVTEIVKEDEAHSGDHQKDNEEISEDCLVADHVTVNQLENLLDGIASEEDCHYDQQMTGSDGDDKQISKSPSKTPKPLLLTPTSKSSSKKLMSAGRMMMMNSCVIDDDVNKENMNMDVNNTPSKTEPGKVLLSAMSMGKLKKEFKQLSEKKRPALQSRSDNHCSLASP